MSLTKVTYSMIQGDVVNVLDYGADSTGVTDSTTAIELAINTGKSVFFPSGTYACNVSINRRTVMFGEGSTVSIIKPFANTSPAMVYTYTAQSTPTLTYWNYHSEVRNLGFKGTGASGAAAVGIGFAFGGPNPAVYVSNGEYANNVTFYNCFFSQLEKGVQFSFGNIGSSFFACGFQGNYYGVYMLDNKTGQGDAMHAGNKYFYGSNFSFNVCAIYLNNATDGFGAVSFTDTICELNNIGAYIYNSSITFTPVQFKDFWCEKNGDLIPGGPSSVTIDVWTGGVKTTTSVNVASYILYNDLTLIDGSFVTGVELTKDNARVYVKNSRVEATAGFVGQASSITFPNSNIYYENCISASGFNASLGYIGNAQCVGVNTSLSPSASDPSSTLGSRFRYLPVSYSVSTSSGVAGVNETFVTAQAYTGAGSGTGTVVSGQSPKYATSNRFSFVFANSSQYYSPSATATSIFAGTWVAFTCDVYLETATAPVFVELSDLNLIQAGRIVLANEAAWRTIGGVAYIPNAGTVNLWFSTGVAQTISIQTSAFQAKFFANQGEAENFIASRTYLD
jgi:hypothetical protein